MARRRTWTMLTLAYGPHEGDYEGDYVIDCYIRRYCETRRWQCRPFIDQAASDMMFRFILTCLFGG